MRLAGFVLFLHIAAAIIGFAIAGILHVALPRVARARSVQEMRPWLAVVHRLEPLLPLTALALLGLGAWLIHLSGGEFRWSDGWIITAVVTLVVIEALAGALLAPRTKALTAAVERTPDGPVPDELRRQACDPIVSHLGFVATFGFTGVVLLMASKPSGTLSAVIVLVGAAVGLVLSTLQLRATAAVLAGTATVPSPRAAVVDVTEETSRTS